MVLSYQKVLVEKFHLVPFFLGVLHLAFKELFITWFHCMPFYSDENSLLPLPSFQPIRIVLLSITLFSVVLHSSYTLFLVRLPGHILIGFPTLFVPDFSRSTCEPFLFFLLLLWSSRTYSDLCNFMQTCVSSPSHTSIFFLGAFLTHTHPLGLRYCAFFLSLCEFDLSEYFSILLLLL